MRVIEHWFKDTKLSKETHEILNKIRKVYEDSEKLGKDFEKLGKHLSNANSAYESLIKRVELMNNKIRKITDVGDVGVSDVTGEVEDKQLNK